MRIRISENIESIESIRVEVSARALPAQLPELRVTSSVDLSTAVRSLTAALSQKLLASRQVQDVLLERDRLLLTWAYQAFPGAGDSQQVDLLALDLGRYRLEALSPSLPDVRAALESRVTLATAAGGVPLRLPLLSPEDEQLARSMLRQLASQATVLDRAFVHGLVDPDGPAHSVSLRFVHKVLASLLPRAAETTPEHDATIARRDARLSLAAALSAMELTTDDVLAAQPEHVEQGREALSRQLTSLALSSRERGAAQHNPFALLTRGDRNALVLLLAAAAGRGQPDDGVEQFARALVTLRISERVDPMVRAAAVCGSLPHSHDAGRSLKASAAREIVAAEIPDNSAHGDLAELASEEPADGIHAAPPPDHDAQGAPPARRGEAATASDVDAEITPHEHPRSPERGLERRGADLPALLHDLAVEPQNDAPARLPRAAAELAASSYESPIQRTARAARSYRSLAPVGEGARALSLEALAAPGRELASLSREVASAGSPPELLAFDKPLDLSQSLGLGALVAQLSERTQRALRARSRRRRSNIIRALRALGRASRRNEREDASDERERSR